MGNKRVKVTIFGIKDGEEVGLLAVKVRIPPSLRHPKKMRRAYTDGVAAGVARMMEHYQPEGDGF